MVIQLTVQEKKKGAKGTLLLEVECTDILDGLRQIHERINDTANPRQAATITWPPQTWTNQSSLICSTKYDTPHYADAVEPPNGNEHQIIPGVPDIDFHISC